MTDRKFPDIDAAESRIWAQLDAMPLEERASGVSRLRSFLERRGLDPTSEDDEMLMRWSRGEISGKELSKRFSSLVGYVTSWDRNAI